MSDPVSTFPASVDPYLGLTAADDVSQDHPNALSAQVRAVQQVVGTTGSPVPASHEYRLARLEASPLTPFWFRLNPTITTQLGTPRSTGGAPTLSVGTDADGRPFLRVTPAANSKVFIPLLDGSGAPLAVSGVFRATFRTDQTHRAGDASRGGVAWAGAAAAGAKCLAVAVEPSDAVSTGLPICSYADGTLAVFTPSLGGNDAAYHGIPVDVTVFYNAGAKVATYEIGSGDANAAVHYTQQDRARSTGALSASGTQVGLWVQADATSTDPVDFYEVTVWKEPRAW